VNVLFREEARGDALEAFDWYDAHQPGLGLKFWDALDATITRIVRHPLAYVADERGLRRALVSRFPPQLTFEFSDAERDQREQRERDRKHIRERRAALSVEAEEEPKAILKSYEVLRRRVEPIGLVYLWPTTR
jgi:hypothetical protein